MSRWDEPKKSPLSDKRMLLLGLGVVIILVTLYAVATPVNQVPPQGSTSNCDSSGICYDPNGNPIGISSQPENIQVKH